jgi:MYXO-CTERM domain-containing protein
MNKLWWVGIVLVIGCGGGSSSVSIQNFPQQYAETLCAKNFQCCSSSELTGKTQSQCVTDNQSVISFLIAEINASQAQGRVSYDPKASGTCIDSLKAMTCDQFKQGIGGNMAACMAFIMPKVSQGGACTQPFECTTGNCVGADTSTDPAVDGMCAAAPTLAAIGTSCATALCVDGAYCDSTSTCVARKAAGEACTSDDECVNTCDTTSQTCSCYSGCQVAAAPTPATTALSALLLGMGLVVSRARRRRR